ncbi:MAG TPA: aldehyde dehydrogenase family protein [Terriglobales bacterium]|nr:aldehyde dehydrogenase family protein [Terriglobales bacterium]
MSAVAEATLARALNFVNGHWMQPAGERRVERRNPADRDDLVGVVTLSTREEARAAIQAAAEAFPAWRATPAPLRGRMIARAAQIMTERQQELGRVLTREEGKTLSESNGEILRSINVLDFMAGESRRLGGETLPSELPRNLAYTVKQPLGVVACITPWNFPVAIPVWKIAPALVAGNTVVFKPATITAFTGMKVVEIFQEAGLPPGVLNMVVGSGSEVGDELVENPVVKAVSFTGSNEVGSALYAQGARQMKRVQCEMGGKNPLVVLEDADLNLAVESTLQGAFGSTGQRCTATSRAIVVESVADEFVRRLAQRTAELKVGNGAQPGVHVGPSVDESQFQTVLRYLEIGKQEGARLVCGGAPLRSGEYQRGYFVQPTIFDHVQPRMRIAQEEIFGPVLSVIRVPDFETALEVANGVVYGLSSSIYTQNVSRVFEFADRIETGITHINSPTTGGEAQVPFGGMKATGVGLREQGRVAIDFFTELKAVYVDYTGAKRESNIY